MTTWTLKEKILSGMKIFGKDEINITIAFTIYES